MVEESLGKNMTFPIYNADGTPFHDLVLRKAVVDSVVMSLGDKITGEVYYRDNSLKFSMHEYIEYYSGNSDVPTRYILVNPPTVVREGLVSDNSELKGMTKYSFEFYHPMCQLSNIPFTDVAVSEDEKKYLSENKKFNWIGKPDDYIAKLNKNLDNTQWIVEKSSKFPSDKNDELSDVMSFEDKTIADALKDFYDTWEVPFVIDRVSDTEDSYEDGKRFKVVMGLPSDEIFENEQDRLDNHPFVFRMGKGVGLKNNSRNPRNNKIVTRIGGYGSEDNIPYGYPQIVWQGDQRWDYTDYIKRQGMIIIVDGKVVNEPAVGAYPLYNGIVGGRYVKLIKHPFTRTHLMPSIFRETVNRKVNPFAIDYDPDTTIVDYYDAIPSEEYPYPNEINPQAPSYESHEFDVKPEMNDGLNNVRIVSARPINDSDQSYADTWDDSMNDNGEYNQGYFKIRLPKLSFDLYACAAITQEMQVNMRSGACLGCTFTVQVDWDSYKNSFYDSNGNFLPEGAQRDLSEFPRSDEGSIEIILQKDIDTFGTLMPNIYQNPKAGDEFVILGISLPIEYIDHAEQRLDKEIKSYMLQNNVYYYDYPLKFDEHFLVTNKHILSQIKPNSIIRFGFYDEELSLYVKQLTVKFDDGVLPKYDITLTDDIEVVLNQIGQVAEDVNDLGATIALLRETYDKNIWAEVAKKLSKTQDDVSSGLIGFLKGLWVKAKGLFGFDENGNIKANNAEIGGILTALNSIINNIESSNYTSGELTGTGFKLTNDNGSGNSRLEVDEVVARMKFVANVLEARKYVAMGGNYVFSPAASVIERVDYIRHIEGTVVDYASVEYAGGGAYEYHYDIPMVAGQTITLNPVNMPKYIRKGNGFVAEGSGELTYTATEDCNVRIGCYDGHASLSFSVSDINEILGYEELRMPWILRGVPLWIASKLMSKSRLVYTSVSDTDKANATIYRCWIKADDGTTKTINTWREGMLARCQTLDIKQSEGGTNNAHEETPTSDVSGYTGAGQNKFYWRAVVGKGQGELPVTDGKEHSYVDLSNESGKKYPTSQQVRNDIPEAGDSIVCYGDYLNRDTSNVIVIETVGEDAPAIKEFLEVGYKGDGTIDWSLTNKLMTRISPKRGNLFVAPEFKVIINNEKRDLATFIINTDGMLSEVKSVQDNGKNLLKGVLTGEDWVCSDSGLTAVKMTDDGGIYNDATQGGIVSPILAVSADKYYCLSAFLNANENAYVWVLENSNPNRRNVSTTVSLGQGTATNEYYEGKRRYYWRMQGQNVNVALRIGDNIDEQYPVYNPQLEVGDSNIVPTAFEAGGIETSSRIRQTADEIDLVVTKLGETGININGNNRTITAKADNFTVKNSSNQTTFSIDQDGNLQSSGSAYFSGDLKAKNIFRNTQLVAGNTAPASGTDAVNVNVEDGVSIVYIRNMSNVTYPVYGTNFNLVLGLPENNQGRVIDVYNGQPYYYGSQYDQFIKVWCQNNNNEHLTYLADSYSDAANAAPVEIEHYDHALIFTEKLILPNQSEKWIWRVALIGRKGKALYSVTIGNDTLQFIDGVLDSVY